MTAIASEASRAARRQFHELTVARVDRLCDDAAAVTFDVPGAASTNAQSINDLGVVTGAYSDANNNLFGFLRF